MISESFPLTTSRTRTGTTQRRQPESNRWGVPDERGRSRTVAKRLRTALAVLLISNLSVQAEAHVPGCHTRKCDRRISAKRHRLFWVTRWLHLSPGAHYWTRCVSGLESGNRRIARESGFLSYFQWVLSTWHSAGGTGNPETHSWHEQAIKAWRWHISHPWGQWPATGENGHCGS